VLLGYNTNGFAHHRLPDALSIIAELGYSSIAITLDIHHLDPYAPGHAAAVAAIATQLQELGLTPVIETGARFLLDPRRKHRPTLLSDAPAERAVRIDFLKRAIDTAAALGAPVVSLWSGSPDSDLPQAALDDRLAAALRPLCATAAAAGVTLGFEPEPGMYIEDMAAYTRIRDLVDHPAFCLTLDVGHAHITEPAGAEATVRAFASEAVNVHLEGMRRSAHDHLPPDQGDMDLLAVTRALLAASYAGPATFELSRHSHDAVRTARAARAFLAPVI
jgi:L-ribulose-5-phosphate 3-epimerase